MKTDALQKTINIQVPEGFNLCVEFMGAGGQLCVNGHVYSVNELGLFVPANDQQTPPNLAPRALEVGQRLRDGTIVLSVDYPNNSSLRVPAQIFGGNCKFYGQDNVKTSANKKALHGHTDWRCITDEEGDTLRSSWYKITNAAPQWFWLPAYNPEGGGYIELGGRKKFDDDDLVSHRGNASAVVIRSGPAHTLDI